MEKSEDRERGGLKGSWVGGGEELAKD